MKPRGKRGSIQHSRRDGEGTRSRIKGVYAHKTASGNLRFKDIIFNIIPIKILPPALSPAQQSTSPVQP